MKRNNKSERDTTSKWAAILKAAGIVFSLLLALFSSMGIEQSCLAQEPENSEQIVQSASDQARSITAAPLVPQRALTSIPQTFEIYQYDESPLGNRTPLLLIHGLQGEFHTLFRWQQLAQYLSRNADFAQKFKIYLARYNTHESLKDITEAFKLALRDLPARYRLTIVVISMPCTIIRNAMKDPAVDQSILRVVALGGFFRGSPLFCSDWMHESIRERHLSPFYILDRYLDYKLYFSLHKNLLRDYCWDNADGQMPLSGKSNEGDNSTVLSNSPEQSLTLPDRQQEIDHKFVVYAGYLHNRYVPRQQGAVHVLALSPFTLLCTTLPAHFLQEHAALRFLNRLIADAIPGKAYRSEIIYPLNDGISPIASSLLLSNDFVAHCALRSDADFADIQAHSSARKSRLFDNIDHLTFIEYRRPHGSAAEVADVLSPSEKPRPMFAWILNDILQ